jgi:hypothetical protein
MQIFQGEYSDRGNNSIYVPSLGRIMAGRYKNLLGCQRDWNRKI